MTPCDGCDSRLARSPSLVSRIRPSVSASRRPTWNSRSSRSATNCPIDGRPSGSCIVETTPLGLFSAIVMIDESSCTRMPSTWMTAVSGSTRTPSSSDLVAVDRHAAGGDEVLARAARAEARRREHLLQAHAVGVVDVDRDLGRAARLRRAARRAVAARPAGAAAARVAAAALRTRGAAARRTAGTAARGAAGRAARARASRRRAAHRRCSTRRGTRRCHASRRRRIRPGTRRCAERARGSRRRRASRRRRSRRGTRRCRASRRR